MTRLPTLGPRGEGWVLIQGVLLVVVATAGWVLGPDWAGPARFVGTIVGTLLIAGGALLVVRAVADLGTAVTPLPMPRDHAGLIETGAFGLVRHPIYGGFILAALGWAIVQASIITIALAVLLAGYFRLKSAREEAWLEARFPGYAAYRRRTPRFIPWIGRSSG
jgi:protein-S-isoprenylcysteine O-methyltransferase Ste14